MVCDGVMCEHLLISHCSQLAEGVGHLLFEVCKGVETKFHSCTTKVCATMSSPPALHLQTNVCIEYCAVCVPATVPFEHWKCIV